MFNRQPHRHNKDAERFAASALSRLPVVEAPEAIWSAIEASLRTSQVKLPIPAARWLQPRRVFAVAVILLMAAVPVYWRVAHRARWEVVRTVGEQSARKETVSAGDWLQTDASSRAELRVGNIGTVIVEPNTKLRILTTRPDEHRLSLAHGEIAATISAPPKLFFVETKSATATDLGCEYKMKVDDAGNGVLRVTRGWVSFDSQGRESLVPAGASCRTHAGAGPGTPFFDDASQRFTQALDDFDFAGDVKEIALRTVLNEARPRDTITLWHLLARVDGPLRVLVYDRIISFSSPPAGVSREKILALDPQALKIWKDELAWTW